MLCPSRGVFSLSEIDPYVKHVSERVVRMFQRYAQDIDPEEKEFLRFISEHLKVNNVKDPKAISYAQLYKYIKEGIREFLRTRESRMKRNKGK